MTPTDPIMLAAQARGVIAKLHERGDVVVQFKTDESEYAEDKLTDADADPGHFRHDKIVLSMNLDRLISKGKPRPTSLATVEDFRLYPVLAGVAAHESAHARFSLWGTEGYGGLPAFIPNPDYDPAAEPGSHESFEAYPVSETGALLALSKALEEPRVERIGSGTFTKTWRRAMQFSAGRFVLEKVDEDDENELNPLDAAVNMAILVGGREMAGTLGNTFENRAQVRKVLDAARAVVEKALEDNENAVKDPFDKIMEIVNSEVFNNDHTGAESHLEHARQILKIVHPESQDDPDSSGAPGLGMGGTGGEGEGEEGDGEGGVSGMSEAMKGLRDEMQGAMDAFGDDMQKLVEKEEEMIDSDEDQGGGGYGAVQYQNELAPKIGRHEAPNDKDRELFRDALAWMEDQVQPTATDYEIGQWLPGSGSRLNVRSKIRDDLAGHKGSQRSDWDKRQQTVKAAPPVKVGIMLDGSGSMHAMARPSASIAWAVSNAAAALPESRTVSVVYGAGAAYTQQPGHAPAKNVAISNTDGPWENFIDAAKLVEDGLWLDEPTEDGAPMNTLIIIVTDLMYGGRDDKTGESQWDGFLRITREWANRGIRVMVIGADGRKSVVLPDGTTSEIGEAGGSIEFVKPGDLFK